MANIKAHFFSNFVSSTPNTEIGGVSATITNATQLATYLNITDADIYDFTIDGANITCNINAVYRINISAFEGNLDITYWHDIVGNCQLQGVDTAIFKDATNFTSAIFNGTTVIPNSMFRDSGLNSYVGEAVISIDARAFQNTDITSITLPNFDGVVNSSSFSGCNQLVTFTSPPITQLISGAFASNLLLTTLPSVNSVVVFNSSCLSNTPLLALTINSTAFTTVATSAFQNCGLTSVVAPNITTIGLNGFRQTNATSYVFQSCTSVLNFAFFRCFNALTIDVRGATSLGTSVTDNSVFLECNALTSLVVAVAMQTNNGGSPHASVQWVIDNTSATITYI